MVLEIESEAEFWRLLESAGNKPVLVDFYADWCGPCRKIAPKVNDLESRNPDIQFAKLNVDKVNEIATQFSITSLPSFLVFVKKQKVDMVVSGQPDKLEALVKKYAKSTEGMDKFGHMELLSLISLSESECLNENDSHALKGILSNESSQAGAVGSQWLESDADEQLVIFITFSQNVKISALKLIAPYENAPKNVKLFINQPSPIDFSAAEAADGVQAFELTSEQVQSDSDPLALKFVKFQNIRTLTLFVYDNQAGTDITKIDKIIPIGSPVATTNMTDFKRVAGKAGEGHE